MVVYLPIAALKDWICSLMNAYLYKDLCVDSNVISTSTGLNTPLRINEMHHGPETENGLVTDKDLSEREEGWPLIAKNGKMSLTCLNKVVNLVHGILPSVVYILRQYGLQQR